MAYVVQAWLPLIVWQQVDAPEYHKGFITVSCISAMLIVSTLITRKLHEDEKARLVFPALPEHNHFDTDETFRKQNGGSRCSGHDSDNSEEAQMEINMTKGVA